MSSLKELRLRRKSVESTKKITSAMKMIAAAKLKRAQKQVEDGRSYSDRMDELLFSLIERSESFEHISPLITGLGRHERHLIIVAASDRGLCGSFNLNIARKVREVIGGHRKAGRQALIYCLGRKGRDMLRRDFGDIIAETQRAVDKPTFLDAVKVSKWLQNKFKNEEFDHCTIVYNTFISALKQEITTHQLIPFTPLPSQREAMEKERLAAVYAFEPNEEHVLNELLPRNLSVQIYRALLENDASEQAARMVAMDGAMRNANDMIDKLALLYNRTRQAYITRELIEIISGAEAL
jgi:F-type H+-transporting ATPase subunit gamma